MSIVCSVFMCVFYVLCVSEYCVSCVHVCILCPVCEYCVSCVHVCILCPMCE